LETLPQTIDLLKIIEKTGVSAIAVHTRYLEILNFDNSRHIPERPRDPAHWDSMKLITAQSAVNVPLIVNGDVFKYSDIAKVKEETGILFFKRMNI
jgi:tRNA-dihydrouridine synthase 2